ncbi:MAG: MATE family efflux transporter [Clostridia bacterium]|nr:MATE family efflux transporter [Clostridia bacterium]
MLLTKDKGFYRTFWRLFFMIVLQNAIVLSVNLADNLMIGSYSETALAGVAAVNSLQFLYQQLTIGIGDALVTMGSQYWGQGRTAPIKQLGKAALLAGAFLGVLLFVLTSLFPYQIVGLFSETEAIVEQGVQYLAIVRWTYLFFAVSSTLLSLLRTVEIVRISTVVSAIALVTNCSINYMLISGNLGAPELGVRGAAIGTLIARALELCIILAYYMFIDKRLCVRKDDLIKTDFSLMRDYFKHCLYFVMVSFIFGSSVALQNVILGNLSDSAIAANSIASTLFQMLKVMAVGAASATAIIIGKTVGSGDLKKLKEYVRTFQIIFLCISLLTGVTLFIIRSFILEFYDLTPETYAMAKNFLLVLCVTGMGTAYQMPVNIGIVRGGGDSKFVFINDLVSIWGIVLPLSFLGAFVFHWDPTIVLLCLNSDQIFKCAAAAIKANRYKWVKKLTRETAET